MEKNQPQVLFPFEPAEMWEKIREIVRSEIQSAKEGKEPISYEVPGMTEKPLYKAGEVCTLLQISRQTLHCWVKEGLIRAYKIKSRVFFLWRDIEGLIQKDPK